MNLFRKQFIALSSSLSRFTKAQLFFLFSSFLLVYFIPFHRVSSSIPTIFIVTSMLFLFLSNSQLRSAVFLVDLYSHAYLFLSFGVILIFALFSIIHPLGSALKINLIILIPLYFINFTILFQHFKIDISILFKTYLLGLAVFSILILAVAIFNYPNLGYKAFYYIDLLKPVKANPIIHSLFYNLGILFAAFEFKKSKDSRSKIVFAFLVCFFVLLVGLCGAKIGYIILIVSSIGALHFMIRSAALKLIAILFSLTSMYFAYQHIPVLTKKIDGFVWQIQKREKISLDDQLPRSIIWPLAWDLIKEHPAYGLGVGNTQPALIASYKKIGYTKGIVNEFNAHNQFLEIGLQIGWTGLALLILLISYCYYTALKYKSLLYFLSLVILTFYLMIESLFESQMGIVAFGVFNGLFIAYLQKQSEIKPSLIDSLKPSNL